MHDDFSFVPLLFPLAAIGAYFAPATVAICRRHNNAMAIGFLNLLLGWTVLGWIAALIWAVSNPPQRQ